MCSNHNDALNAFCFVPLVCRNSLLFLIGLLVVVQCRMLVCCLVVLCFCGVGVEELLFKLFGYGGELIFDINYLYYYYSLYILFILLNNYS